MKTKEQVLNWVDYMLKSNPCMNVEDRNMFNAIKYYIAEKQTDGDLISRFRDYQIEWLTSHNDIDLHETEMWVVQFLKDTAECFLKTELPSVENTAEWRIVGKTTLYYECSKCGGSGDKWDKFCKHCGAKMDGKEEQDESSD